jgi:hypothetical protein
VTQSTKSFFFFFFLVESQFLQSSSEPWYLCIKQKKTFSMAFSPWANYTDWAAAACQWGYHHLLWVKGGHVVRAMDLGFLDQSHYFFIQVAPHLSSQGWVDPVPDPLLLRKSGSARNGTQDLWVCSQELWPLDHVLNKMALSSKTELFICRGLGHRGWNGSSGIMKLEGGNVGELTTPEKSLPCTIGSCHILQF